MKNLSFLVSHEGIELAPFYDLLSTGVYETAAFAGSTWPDRNTMAWPLPGATYIGDVDREVLINAGKVLGLNKTTSTRLLNVQLQQIMPAAEALYEDMLLSNKSRIANGEVDGQSIHWEAESRCIKSIIYSIIAPMQDKLARPTSD